MYYKVVRRTDNNKLISFCNISPIEYKINEWVYPEVKGSKLFVFGELHYASLYVVSSSIFSSGYEVWKCEINECEEYDGIVSSSGGNIYLFWAKFNSLGAEERLEYLKNRFDKMYVPKSTILTDKVKLLEKATIEV